VAPLLAPDVAEPAQGLDAGGLAQGRPLEEDGGEVRVERAARPAHGGVGAVGDVERAPRPLSAMGRFRLLEELRGVVVSRHSAERKSILKRTVSTLPEPFLTRVASSSANERPTPGPRLRRPVVSCPYTR
jgi:hypothetical protein